MPPGDIWRIAHLALLSLWGGIVITEGVLEILPLRKKKLLRSTVIFHYYIDIALELPVISLVVVTGIVNLFFVPITTLQMVKIGAAAVAIAANLYCIRVVIRRYRGLRLRAGERYLAWEHRKVLRSAAIGLPFAAAAAALGFYISMSLIPRAAGL